MLPFTSAADGARQTTRPEVARSPTAARPAASGRRAPEHAGNPPATTTTPAAPPHMTSDGGSTRGASRSAELVTDDRPHRPARRVLRRAAARPRLLLNAYARRYSRAGHAPSVRVSGKRLTLSDVSLRDGNADRAAPPWLVVKEVRAAAFDTAVTGAKIELPRIDIVAPARAGTRRQRR